MSFSKGITSGSDGGGSIVRSAQALNEAGSKNPQVGTGPDDYGSIMKTIKMLTGMKKGGKVSSASKRADGCAVKGKTRGRMV